ncbi:MAG: transglutaminase domain-containing protein, partial [Nitrospirae bacterium]
SNDEKIIKLAGQLKNKNPQETARTIYKWVSGNLRYSGYAKDPKGARYALETKEGDCTEYMYLFVALCRANQIPARGVGGFICRQNSLLRPEAYHNWAEFYYNKAWRLTDPQNKVFMEDEGDYIAMRYAGILKGVPISDDGMFGFAGEGIKAKMN